MKQKAQKAKQTHKSKEKKEINEFISPNDSIAER